MKIAIPYENEQVFQHFGRTLQFKMYEIENQEIVKSYYVNSIGQGHFALSQFLEKNKVNVVICGGIGTGALHALNDFGIKVYGGVIGNCDEAIQNYLSGNLVYNPNIKYSCHDDTQISTEK